MKRIKKIANFALIGGFGLVIAGSLAGCNDSSNNTGDSQQAQKGAFVVIEETSPGKYKVQEEFPSDETRIVLKKLDGTEKVLTKEEMDELVKEENAKIDNGTSNLTKQNDTQVSSGGFSLGEAILASAAGAMIGSWIGGKLFNNPSYQNQRQTAYKSPSAYSKSASSFTKTGQASSAKSGRSGFFGGGSKSGGSKSGFFGG